MFHFNFYITLMYNINMDDIYKNIKKLRQSEGLSQIEFGKIIGLSPQSISGLEKGRTDLDTKKVRAICEHFNISADELLGIRDETNKLSGIDLSKDRDNVFRRYYELDDHGREIASMVIDKELERVRNDSSRAIFYPLIEDASMVELDYYGQSAGMGRGQDVIPSFPEKIEVLNKEVPDYTDFVIRVTGDSMLPTFKPGDLLFVQKTKVLNPGDIGVFVVDGETMVKEYGINGLISHNEKYGPITNAESCIIQGRVRGKLNRRS